jgi:hypothetical protein
MGRIANLLLPSPAKIALVITALALTGLAGACSPPNTEYELGFGTTAVSGIVDLGLDRADESDAIVVVLKNHDMFIPIGQRDELSGAAPPDFSRNITHPTAHVVQVTPEGAYFIDMPSNVVSMDIMFIARDKLTRRAHFNRSAAISRIKYRAILQPMPDWRSHFYTYLEPQLQDYIVEPRYKLSIRGQRRLGKWLNQQKKSLEAGRHQG